MNNHTQTHSFLAFELSMLLGVVIFITIPLVHIANVAKKIFVPDALNLISSFSLYTLLALSFLFIIGFFGLGFSEKNSVVLRQVQKTVCTSFMIAIVLTWVSDLWWIKLNLNYEFIKNGVIGFGSVFTQEIYSYLASAGLFYSLQVSIILFLPLLLTLCEKNYFGLLPNKYLDDSEKRSIFIKANLFVLILPIVILVLPLLINTLLFVDISKVSVVNFENMYLSFRAYSNSLYFIVMLTTILILVGRRSKNHLSFSQLIKIIKTSEKISIATLFLQLIGNVAPFFMIAGLTPWEKLTFATSHFWINAMTFLPNLVLVFILLLMREHYRKKQADDDSPVEQTTGSFGTASWMSEKEMLNKGCFNLDTGPIFGTNEDGQPISLPLYNTLTLGPPGMGKSLMYIATLLKDTGPKFVWDIKGELFLTTARYRSKEMGRQIILLDFYNILASFTKDFPSHLRVINRINPFDYVPEDAALRDRMLTSFVTSFIISDSDHSGTARHFDENAKILIRGYIDFIMKTIPQKEKRTMKKLYALMCESKEEAENTFIHMQDCGGHAAAAANQVLSVGSQERGSIISTAYRQIDWASDINIQEALSESTFNLKDFLNGNMDIYVVLPSEQVQEKSRLFRIILSLLKSMITQADPRELPQDKMMFLMDELAQLGYCPDIEQFIEVMRSYKVVVWAAFQALSQVKVYKKPDLFLGAPIKQFFTSNDLDTVKWIQALAGKKTIKTKSLSSGKSDTNQKMKALSGNISRSEGENVHETGVDLININEIREMPKDEQIIFWSGHRPLRCKKIFYYKHPYFKGKFDENPFEGGRPYLKQTPPSIPPLEGKYEEGEQTQINKDNYQKGQDTYLSLGRLFKAQTEEGTVTE